MYLRAEWGFWVSTRGFGPGNVGRWYEGSFRGWDCIVKGEKIGMKVVNDDDVTCCDGGGGGGSYPCQRKSCRYWASFNDVRRVPEARVGRNWLLLLLLLLLLFSQHFFEFQWSLLSAMNWVFLLLSTTANTVITATQTHLEVQENHPKFLWEATSAIKIGVVTIFFFGRTTPLEIGHDLSHWIRPSTALPIRVCDTGETSLVIK